jgi:hypothetical protein
VVVHEHFEHMLSSEQRIDHSAETFSKQSRWHSRLRNKMPRFERASWNSLSRSFNVTSRYCMVISGEV